MLAAVSPICRRRWHSGSCQRRATLLRLGHKCRRLCFMDLLEKMSTYVRVIEAGSFSAAAKQVRLSPAAVSRQIAALEAEVRFPLVLRSTRRMEVTPAGRRYYERCLRILREID